MRRFFLVFALVLVMSAALAGTGAAQSERACGGAYASGQAQSGQVWGSHVAEAGKALGQEFGGIVSGIARCEFP
jgi:hypothetical protein